MTDSITFTLFYDGHCPICQKEIAWLRRRNRWGKLGLQDIHATDFDPAVYGKTHAELMAEIHGVFADGRVIKGMPVFRASYQAVGLGWVMAATGWPILNVVFDYLYQLFARYRIQLGHYFSPAHCHSGRCQPKP